MPPDPRRGFTAKAVSKNGASAQNPVTGNGRTPYKKHGTTHVGQQGYSHRNSNRKRWPWGATFGRGRDRSV